MDVRQNTRHPVYNRKTYKVKLTLFPEFIFGAHYSLNVPVYKLLNKPLITTKPSGWLANGFLSVNKLFVPIANRIPAIRASRCSVAMNVLHPATRCYKADY